MAILQDEINDKRKEIAADSYAMSIGELISIYQSDEMDIHPEFQRFYRWTNQQKTNLIESILLGIPLPPIFVAQRPDGVWDIIDGLQRLSTIFQFIGELKDEKGKHVKPLVLEQAKYLPSLKGKVWDAWDKTNRKSNIFTPSQRILLKRAKIGVTIILPQSDKKAKYELFQRLNTGGTSLSPQEVRNCILVMINPEFYEWIRSLAEDKNFLECLALTDRAIDEQYDKELVLRFLVFRNLESKALKDIGDVGTFLTEEMEYIATSKDYDQDKEASNFRHTFELLNRTLGADSFRRYDKKNERFVGGFLVSAYESVALGIGYNYSHQHKVLHKNSELIKKIKAMWSDARFVEAGGSGIRASTRIPKTVSLGREIFSS